MSDQLPIVQVMKEKLLRIDICEIDEWEGQPLYDVILRRAAKLGIAAGTVYRGLAGYAEDRRGISTWNSAPLLVVLVGREDRIEQLITALKPMLVVGAVISISDVEVMTYAQADRTLQTIAPEAPRP